MTYVCNSSSAQPPHCVFVIDIPTAECGVHLQQQSHNMGHGLMRRRITHVRTSSFASPSQRPPSEGRSRPSLPQVPPGCRLWPAQSPCFSGAGSPVLDSLRRRHRSALCPPRPGVLNYQHVISVHLQRN